MPRALAKEKRSKQGSNSLKILVLGGTGFIGPHMVREALRRGHDVTLFNRGKTDRTLFPDLELLVGDRDNGTRMKTNSSSCVCQCLCDDQVPGGNSTRLTP